MRILTKLWLAMIILLFMGCDDLPLQKNFDYDGEAIDLYVYMTAMEWLESKGEQFSEMIEAIEYAEMTSYYTQTDVKYTFLVIQNTALKAWANNNGGLTISDVDKIKVQNLLKYHIIKGQYSAYNKETPIEPVFVKNLLSGEDGLMTIRCVKSSYPIYGETVTSGNIMINTTRSNGVSPQRGSVTSNIFPTNGVIHVFSDYAYYKRDNNYKVLF